MSQLLIKNASAIVTCNDGSNLLEEIRAAFLLHRLHSSSAAPGGYEILKMAARGSARILGRSDIGSIETGKVGDLFMVRRSRLKLTGADLDERSMPGTAGIRDPVDYTVVNGNITVRNGRLTGIDEEKEAGLARACVRTYLDGKAEH